MAKNRFSRMRPGVSILQGTWRCGLKRCVGYSYRYPEFVFPYSSCALSLGQTDFSSISYGYSYFYPLACPDQIPAKTRTARLFLPLHFHDYQCHRAHISLPLRILHYRLYMGYFLAVYRKLHSCDHGFFHSIPFVVRRTRGAPKSQKGVKFKLETATGREEATGCGSS